MADERIDIFTEDDQKTGIQKMKSEAHAKGLWHRAAHIWIYNDKGEILLQLRAKNKDTYPNCWDISAAGHVSAGEEVIISALRELEEEIGIKAKEEDLEFLKVIKKKQVIGEILNNEFFYVYLFKFNGKAEELPLQKEEVAEIKFFTPEEFLEGIEKAPEKFTPLHDYQKWVIGEVKKRINFKKSSMKQQNIIILNGWTQGDISEIPEFLPNNPANWMGWSKQELEKQGYKVETPYLRHAYKQEYEEWKEELDKLDINENTILVGWSAGGAFWVRWLGETKRKIHKLILVAPAKLYENIGPEGNFDRFMNFTIDPDVKHLANEIVIFISNDTDDLVKSAHLYQKKLDAKLVKIENQGHFTNVERVSPEFPELIEEVKKQMNN